MSEAHPSGLPCYRVLSAGDTALTIELGEGIDRRISALVLALTRRLNERLLRGVVETLPTLRPCDRSQSIMTRWCFRPSHCSRTSKN